MVAGTREEGGEGQGKGSSGVQNPPTMILAWFLREDERSWESIHWPDDTESDAPVGSRAGRIRDQNTPLELH